MRALSIEDSAMNTAISAKTVVKRCDAWKASAKICWAELMKPNSPPITRVMANI